MQPFLGVIFFFFFTLLKFKNNLSIKSKTFNCKYFLELKKNYEIFLKWFKKTDKKIASLKTNDKFRCMVTVKKNCLNLLMCLREKFYAYSVNFILFVFFLCDCFIFLLNNKFKRFFEMLLTSFSKRKPNEKKT